MNINEAYKILGVDQSASEEQVKNAYRERARAIQEQGSEDSPQLMQRLDDAYDAVINQMRMGSPTGTPGAGYVGLNDIKNMINSGRMSEAEQLLDGMPRPNRTAEWYYLKGMVLKNKGWLEDAKTHFAAAARMDPSNREYQNAVNGFYQSDNTRQNPYNGGYGGYNGSYGNGGYNNGGYRTGPAYNNSGCSACDICSSLICADCCCECMGGDLIPCC